MSMLHRKRSHYLDFIVIIIFLAFSLITFHKFFLTINLYPIDSVASLNSNLDQFEVPNSIIRFHTADKKPTSVVIGKNNGISIVKVGNSTLLEPHFKYRSKIDRNLLNLTKLITDNYLENNRTRIILSTSHIKTARILKKLNGSLYRIYESGNAPDQFKLFAANISYSSLFELAQDPYVNYIWLDRRFRICLDESIEIVKNSTEWTGVESAFQRKINGTGVSIAILDTGIDSNHPDFYFPNGTSKVIASVSFVGGSTTDRYGHGTHCASIAAGTGEASSGQYIGVAPGANLMNVKVLNDQGDGFESWIISGIQWAVDNGADILSMSFGVDAISDGTDPMSMTIDWVTEQGLICAVAAGNQGSQMYTITVPGVAHKPITVGATSKQDTIADFSSRGPTVDYRIKPDLLAPGIDIIAARAGGSNFGNQISEYYTKASGTSMATPHVAGVAALMLDAYPYWSPKIVKSALTNYAKNLKFDVYEQGSGRLDICASIRASIVGNSSISFGRVHFDSINEHVVVLQNLAVTTQQLTLDVNVWFIENKITYDIASLIPSTLVILSNQSRELTLRLNTSEQIPLGYFEGRINITSNESQIRIPFSFCILSLLKCETYNEGGSKIRAAFTLIDADSEESIDFSRESEYAQFILMPGEYIVQAMNIYGLKTSGGSIDNTYAFLIHQKVTIGSDETKTVQLSLTSANKLSVHTSNLTGSSLHIKFKQILSPYYHMAYVSDIGPLSEHYLYLSNLSEYVKPPCYYGYMGFSQDDLNWLEYGSLLTEVDTYFIGWDISEYNSSNSLEILNYTTSDLATFEIDNLFPITSSNTSIWFNHIAGLWQTGLWYGYQTHPGICWKAHILPYHYWNPSVANWSEMEWSCTYSLLPEPYSFIESFVIDRHFQPIAKGDCVHYFMGKTPLVPQTVHNYSSDYGDGLSIPGYPLKIQDNLFLAKTGPQAIKQVEVYKDDLLIYNQTKLWAPDSILISGFLESLGYGLYSIAVTTETGMNLSSKNYAEYIINYTNTSTDLIPPSIIEIDTPSCFTTNSIPVEIVVADNNNIDEVSLFYSLDEGPWVQASLEESSNNTYSANLNLSTTSQEIALAIEAQDIQGNTIGYSTSPSSQRGSQTEIIAQIDSNKISGKLNIITGNLKQPIYLTVKTAEGILQYTRTDTNGNFEFSFKTQALTFPLEIEMKTMGSIQGSTLSIYQPDIRDIAIMKIINSKSVTGNNVYVNITISNQGSFSETFNITTYANTSIIDISTTTLNIYEHTTISFLWNATHFPKGNYQINANIPPIDGESDTSDNNIVGDWICVTIIGDVDGDFDVDIFDVVMISSAYQSQSGDPNYSSNYDIDNDGDVDIFDVVASAMNYGEVII